MSFSSMSKALAQGEIPGVPLSLAQKKINEALGYFYDISSWSFQGGQYANWLAPGLVANVGTVTVTPYSDSVVGDATAAAAWNALVGRPLLTELQFRSPSYSLYNIVAYDGVNTLTLDRPWLEPPSGPGMTYMIYQAYFPAPVADFRHFNEVRDTMNAGSLHYWELSQADLAVLDPQRTVFSDPDHVVPVGVDQRPGSATLGYQLFELWPHQLSKVPYSFSYDRRGPNLVDPGDTVPFPLTEELISHRAKELLYLYKEGNKEKDKELSRGSGSNWQFLAQFERVEWGGKDGNGGLLQQVRSVDANLHNNFQTRVSGKYSGRSGEPFSNRLGDLNVGGYRG
jgi:hypothetical protein